MAVFVRRYARGGGFVRSYNRKGTVKDRLSKAFAKTVNAMNKVIPPYKISRKTVSAKVINRLKSLGKRYNRLESIRG